MHVALWKWCVGPSEVASLLSSRSIQISQCLLQSDTSLVTRAGMSVCLASLCCLGLLLTSFQDRLSFVTSGQCWSRAVTSVPSYLWVSLSFCVLHPYQLLLLLETLVMCPELHGGKVDWIFLRFRMAVLAWFPGQGASCSAPTSQLRSQILILTVSSN